MVRDPSLNVAFLLSALLHAAAIPVISILVATSSRSQPNIILIDLVAPVANEEKPQAVVPTKPAKSESAPKTAPPPAAVQRELPKAEELQGKKEEPEKPAAQPGGGEKSGAAAGKGGGVENFPGGGDVAVLPGSDLGKSGTGTGSGPPGPGSGEKVSRPAKPVQTAKAYYPPMALRLGVEADVPLKVFVDEDGRVVKVEIVKSAGMGFDDEALRAVRQYRFEPATSDGRRVPSELTYIYRFRLEK